jgi:serine/threonine protein kinase
MATRKKKKPQRQAYDLYSPQSMLHGQQLENTLKMIQYPETSSGHLGTGSYGCVFRPPLPCKYASHLNRKYPQDVMKMMYAPSALREEEISDLVWELDTSGEYFLPLRGARCEVDHEHLVKNQCQVYRDSDPSRQKLFRGYFIPYGGVTISQYFRSNNHIPISSIFNWVGQLTRGLDYLHANGIVHMDLKSNNVVIDQGNAKLIDFGMARMTSDLQPQDYVVTDARYPAFFTMMAEDTLDNMVIRYLYVAYYQGYKSDELRRQLSVLFNEFYQDAQYFENVIRQYLGNVDMYLLAVMFAFDLFKILDWEYFVDVKGMDTILNDLFKRVITIDYRQQYDTQQILYVMKNIKVPQKIDHM